MAFQGLRKAIEDWFFPRPLSVYRGIEFGRCQTDGQLIPTQASQSVLAKHAGHRIVSPVILKWKDKLLLWWMSVKK